jgi:orotidine-5'-phosphate decarboxylase
MPEPRSSDDRLIVALDQPDAEAARACAQALGDAVSFYKIGLGLLPSGGLPLARALKESGKRVFLDMKLYDISATVERAAAGFAAMGVDFLTVHGDPQVVRAAAAGRGDAPTRILAVTVLTSLDRADLDEMLVRDAPLEDIVTERARRALAAGADGLIASPKEAARLRALPEAEGRLIVTPGVRPAGADRQDQKRTATPAEALASGADHIVVGRPVIAAPDPRAAAEAILAGLP